MIHFQLGICLWPVVGHLCDFWASSPDSWAFSLHVRLCSLCIHMLVCIGTGGHGVLLTRTNSSIVSSSPGFFTQSSTIQEGESATQATDTLRIKDVVSRCGALASERPKASYATKNMEQDLARLLRGGNVEQHRDVLERPLAASALAGKKRSISL